MKTPNGQTSGARDGASSTMDRLKRMADVAYAIAQQLLQPRRVYLKHKAPRSSYVHQLRLDVGKEKARPVHMMLSISRADLEDHVPLSLVLQPYQSIIAELTDFAQQLERSETSADAPMFPLLQRENRYQADRDAAERSLLAYPNSVEAHDRFLDASAKYEAENDLLVKRVRSGRARLASSGAVVVAV